LETFALTTLAMLAFAGNSILGRLALGHELIDPASFSSVRCISGAATLALIVLVRHGPRVGRPSAWLPAAMLALYMVCFSFAYLTLGAGTGALILFAAVQVTMIGWALRGGERMPITSWIGFAIAILGLVWLVLPGLSAPDPIGAALMTAAGVAWGAYSLLGRASGDATISTARNFALAVPLMLSISVVMRNQAAWSLPGIGLAVASGAVTSGIGYAVWYAAVPRLSATQAASVQLTVPVIAAVLGVLLLSESLSYRLVFASAAILGGVGIVTARRGGHGAAKAARSDNP
jgi:drug/metabolite transporter (DMT)-like permease